MNHPTTLTIEDLLKSCELTQTRRSGPGGQHRNKTESAIVLTHLPSGIIGQASERRSQHENRAVAIQRLRFNLALAVRVKRLPEQIPSALWQSRRKGQQILVSETHADYPALLAEVFDVLESDHSDLAISAARLGVSTSQLIKFLKRFPAAFQKLNQDRQRLGLGKVK
jgi:hypothetical protein